MASHDKYNSSTCVATIFDPHVRAVLPGHWSYVCKTGLWQISNSKCCLRGGWASKPILGRSVPGIHMLSPARFCSRFSIEKWQWPRVCVIPLWLYRWVFVKITLQIGIPCMQEIRSDQFLRLPGYRAGVGDNQLMSFYASNWMAGSPAHTMALPFGPFWCFFPSCQYWC